MSRKHARTHARTHETNSLRRLRRVPVPRRARTHSPKQATNSIRRCQVRRSFQAAPPHSQSTTRMGRKWYMHAQDKRASTHKPLAPRRLSPPEFVRLQRLRHADLSHTTLRHADFSHTTSVRTSAIQHVCVHRLRQADLRHTTRRLYTYTQAQPGHVRAGYNTPRVE